MEQNCFQDNSVWDQQARIFTSKSQKNYDYIFENSPEKGFPLISVGNQHLTSRHCVWFKTLEEVSVKQ